ncbi:MAG: UDP-N-acetylmuramate--L-alanine ligase [Firmicutes bacterium]|nr:UDP-N-acetylmuramate--L-alanine ligase [Bacillota bacterium]
MLTGIKHVHFVGIGGYGMSALALALLSLGYQVSGSDQKESAITKELCRRGALVYLGHKAENLGKADLLVYSTAIPADNVELKAAKAKGIPLWHRSELLACFINRRFGIAVAGAHGKTTTTSMVASVLTQGGLDPTAFIGGIFTEFGGNARIGKSDIVIAEADESDNSFLRYRPQMAVVTNIEADHLEHYHGDFNLLLQAYEAFLANVVAGGTAVLYEEDQYLKTMRPKHLKKIVTFGLQSGHWRAIGVEAKGWGSRFQVVGPHKQQALITLQVPGRYNVLNALAAVAVARELNVDFAHIQAGLEQFRGAERRFQFLYDNGDFIVVDDYAHHPTEIRATLQAARTGTGKRIIVVFQPHRYSRTKWFFDEFATAFTQADQVILHKIYAAGEAPLADVSIDSLAEKIRQNGTNVKQINDAEEISQHILSELQPGDLIITMGAGDVTDIGHTLAQKLEEKYGC